MVKVNHHAVGVEPIALPVWEIFPGVLVVEPDCWLTPVLDGPLATVLIRDLELMLRTCEGLCHYSQITPK